MGGKIDMYFDCISPYSYFAFLHLQRNKDVLKSHNVDIEFHPVFLGGVNVGSGNQPPWMLPARANYLSFDRQRAMKYFGTPNLRRPDNFPIVTLLPQRCLCYIKSRPALSTKLEALILEYFLATWEQNTDLSDANSLSTVLQRHFSESETREIIEAAGTPEGKQRLNDSTKAALDKGAYGMPWLWVTNKHGKSEPFFGSDRFLYVWQFLEVPFEDAKIKEKSNL